MNGSKRCHINNTEVLPINNAVVQGFSFDAVFVVNEDSGLPAHWFNTSIALGYQPFVDFSKANVRVEVKKANKEHPETVLNMRLDTLVCSTNWNNVNYQAFKVGRYHRWRDDNFTSAVISADVIFPVGVYNIEGGDKMNVTLQISGSDYLVSATDFYPGATPGQKIADVRRSYIDFRPILAHDDVDKRVSPLGFERNMPYNQDTEPFFIGDNVVDIQFYSEQSSGVALASQMQDANSTILHCDIHSKQHTLRLDEYDIHRSHMSRIEDNVQASYAYGHYVLYQGEELDNTEVVIRMRERSILANQEARIVYWAFETDPVTYDRAIVSEKKTLAIQKEKLRKS